ncbi:DUF1194 domain-containing protein [Yoonia sp. MH D7]
MRTLVPLILCLLAPPAVACDTALLLAIDVSNSIDTAEYRLQTDGLANALRNPEIVAAMLRQETAIAVVQWSGETSQDLSIPWTQIRSSLDAARIADTAERMPRTFVLSDTAPAEAILFSLAQFASAPVCKHRVIDISGDGTANAGSETRSARNIAETAGVTINAIAIESMGLAITGFFKRAVITRNGFVITARTHREYPDAIRHKILRELSQALG